MGRHVSAHRQGVIEFYYFLTQVNSAEHASTEARSNIVGLGLIILLDSLID